MLSIALSIVAELSRRLLTVANPPNFIHSKDIKSNPATQERENEQERQRERGRESVKEGQRKREENKGVSWAQHLMFALCKLWHEKLGTGRPKDT